ncbi:phage mu protein F-like protein [Caudoviricetes sp.]|nr:phage mu protein F-like protein [Caudoviricetes sp.]
MLAQARSSSQLVVSATWNRAPIEALQMLVGKLADGSTMGDYLAAKAGEAWPEARTEILRSLATGRNPRRTAAAIRKAMNGNLVSALATSREAQVGTYNQAALEQYRANPNLVRGYRRLSALGPRTCALCWALHGKFYPLGEDFIRHINCRCTAVPDFEGVDNMIGDGEKLFRDSSADLKRKVLGKTEYQLYREGKIQLADLVGYRNSKVWGRSLRRKTLRELEG